MKKFLTFILICAVLITGLIPALADYLGPNPEARIYTISTGQGTTEIQAGNATASHKITCLGTTGVENWCNDNEKITITGTEPKPDNYLNGAELDDGNDVQSIHGSLPPYEFTYRREGDNFADYWVRSTVGDTSDMYEAEFRIDKSAPNASCEIVSTPEYDKWFVGTVTIQGTSTDSISAIQKEIFTAGNKTGTSYINLSDTAVDLLVKMTATDYATNTSTIDCATISIDNTKPVIDSYTTFTNGTLFPPTVNFTMAAHDEHSGLQYMAFIIDGEEYEADASGSIEMEYEHGNHTVIFKAVDNVGNVKQTNPLTFYVDAQSPTFTIDTPVMNSQPNLVSYGSDISGTASDVGGGFGKIYAQYPGSNGFTQVIYTRGNKSKYSETGTWSATLPTTGLTSGYAYITVKGEDIFGNQSEEVEKEVLVDVTKPIPDYEIVGTLGNNNWYTGAVTINGLSEDEHSGVMTETISYSGSGGNGSGSKSVVIPNSKSGSFTITVETIDFANNSAKNNKGKVNVDNTKPVIASTTEFADGDLFGPVVKFNMKATDAHSGVEYMSFIIDGDEYEADSNGSIEIELEHGTHTVVFQVTDNVGLVTKSSSRSFYVDAKAPVTTTNTPVMNGKNNLVTYGSEITGTASDEGGGFGKVYVKHPGSNGFNLAEYTQSSKEKYAESGTWKIVLPTTGLTSGYEIVSVKAEDIFGNMSEPDDIEVLVDVTKPVPSFKISGQLGKTDWYTGAVTLTGTSEDEHSGVMEEVISYSGTGGNGSNKSSVTIPATQSGDFTVSVKATDFANNSETDASGKVKVDNTKPVIDSHTEFADGDLFGPKVKFSMTASDAHSGVDYLAFIIDGDKMTADKNGAIEITLEDGMHTVAFFVEDNVGLSTQTAAMNFYVDAAAPETKTNVPAMNGKNYLVTYGSKITGKATDKGGGFGKVYVEYPGSESFKEATYKQTSKEKYSEAGDWEVTLPSSGLTSGTFVVRVKAEDIFGNMSEPEEMEVLVDVTKPTPSYELEGTRGVNEWYTGSVTIKGISTDEPEDDRTGVMKQVVKYNGSAGSGSGEGQVVVPNTLNGDFNITVETTDYANNKDTVTDNKALMLDNTDPEFVSKTELEAGKWVPSKLKLQVKGTDAHSGVQSVSIIVDGVEHKQNGDNYEYDAVFTTTGDHTVQYKVVDNVNRETLSETYTIPVDVTKPEVSIDSPSINGMADLINVHSEITGTGKDEGSGIDKMFVKLPGDTDWHVVETSGEPTNLTWRDVFENKNSLPSGKVTISAKAIDIVGNESDVVTLEVLLDIDKPVPSYKVEGNELDGWYYGPVVVKNTTTDEHSGVYETSVAVDCDPENHISGSDSITIPVSYSGICTIIVEAEDHAANKNSITIHDAIKVDIDNEKPKMTMFSMISKPEYYPAVSEVCIYDAFDKYSGLAMAYLIADGNTEFTEVAEGNNNEVQVCIPYHLTEGNHTVQFKLVDRVGNESDLSQEFEMIVDNHGPVVQFSVAPSIFKPSEKTIIYTGNVSDPDAGIETLEYSTDGGYTHEEIDIDENGNFTIAVKPEPRMTVLVRAVDKVGNQSTIESEPLQQVSDASSRLVITPSTMANMLIKPSIIDHEGNPSSDFSGIRSARAFVYGRGFDHAEIEMKPENGYAFMWDGYFPTEVKAPKGWYWLTVEFTDLLGKIECYNSRIWVDWDEPEEPSGPQYRTFDISGTVDAIDKVSVTVNASRYMLADFSKVGSDIVQGSKVIGKGRAYTKENVLVVETLERVPDKQIPFNGLIDDLGKDYVIIDGHALVIDENTKFYCVDTRVGDYVSGMYTVDSLNRMYVTEFGPLSCERDVITRVDTGIVK